MQCTCSHHRRTRVAHSRNLLRCSSSVSRSARVCDLPHVDGAGCIKCNGIVSAILSGRATEATLAAEVPTVGVSKNIESDRSGHVQQCNACAAGMAQHPVRDGMHSGATGPNAKPDPQQLCTCPQKEAKARQFYGTEWAGKTGEWARRQCQATAALLFSLLLVGSLCMCCVSFSCACCCAAPDGTQVPQLAVCEGPFEQKQQLAPPVPSTQH